MSTDFWNLMATGISTPGIYHSWLGEKESEPYTGTLFDIYHGIALTDDELAEREEWVQDLMQRPEIDAEIDEDALDNWESNRG